ncbi:MAG TPA: potassium channel protein, partial [Eubacteriaceae bacterium]|nr:potassium channel protein [Eubacteriaceae bacterium]
MEKKEKFITIISAFVIVVIIGIVGYMLLLDVSFIDALYMTAITISTVGYTEVGEMTDPAKIFSIFIIFAGLAVAGYV